MQNGRAHPPSVLRTTIDVRTTSMGAGDENSLTVGIDRTVVLQDDYLLELDGRCLSSAHPEASRSDALQVDELLIRRDQRALCM